MGRQLVLNFLTLVALFGGLVVVLYTLDVICLIVWEAERGPVFANIIEAGVATMAIGALKWWK